MAIQYGRWIEDKLVRAINKEVGILDGKRGENYGWHEILDRASAQDPLDAVSKRVGKIEDPVDGSFGSHCIQGIDIAIDVVGLVE